MDPYYVCRFGLLMDPLGKTGLVWFALRTFTGLSQYPVFKVQAAADFPHTLRFCPLRAASCCFGGEEIHYAFASTVSTARQNICRARFGSLFLQPIGKSKTPPDLIRKALAGQHVGRVPAASWLLCDRLRTAFCFQHALRSRSRFRRCEDVHYTGCRTCARHSFPQFEVAVDIAG